MAAGDAERSLQAAGWPIDKLPDAQREVLADLSPDEVATMVKVRERLMAAGGDVEPYAASAKDNGIFYY
jgi:hypothetical protein